MRIKCPDCSQKFDVTEDFLGKTVECGSCDAQFKVADEHVVAEKARFYPGEKQDKSLDQFGKTAAEVNGPVAFQQAHYQQGVAADVVGPPRPRRTMAAVAGAVILVLTIVVFLLAGGKEGSLRDMETGKRFVFVAFVAVLGGGLLFYGTSHIRKLGLLACVILCGAVLAMPVIFPGNPTLATVVPLEQADAADEVRDSKAEQAQEREDYLFEIGYDPVRTAVASCAPNSVVAIYLRNASKADRGKIAAYLYEATEKVSRETSYDRGVTGLNGLILLVEQKKTLDEIAALCAKFGRIEKISHDLRVIDMTVESAKIGRLDEDKVLNPESLDFQSQNLKALSNIDPDVRMKAVKRLAVSEPKALRPDITRQMLSMLPTSSNEMKVELIRALKVWAQPGDGSEVVVMDAVKELHKVDMVDKSAVDFLIEREAEGTDVILMDLWKKDPVVWSETLVGLGEGAQVLLLPVLDQLNEGQVVAASDILGKVGTVASIPLIEEVMAKRDDAGKKSLQAAIDEIKKRS
ncbi:hypothetical protein JIN77_00995 [Verrucomicrobiaceae bacterium R5-34]|nr:hypothetical protein [Verrucomicrobiaceae bacterium R5-34]